jgi:hypothetical protein
MYTADNRQVTEKTNVVSGIPRLSGTHYVIGDENSLRR